MSTDQRVRTYTLLVGRYLGPRLVPIQIPASDFTHSEMHLEDCGLLCLLQGRRHQALHSCVVLPDVTSLRDDLLHTPYDCSCTPHRKQFMRSHGGF